MARVAVVTSHPPFGEGGHLVIARALEAALIEAGHDATVVLTPQNRFGRQLSAYWATWLTDVAVAHDGRAIDQVISLRFPSFAVRHPRHVCWLNHRMREYYDLWERLAATLSLRARLKERARRLVIRRIDRYLLGHRVSRVVAQSAHVQDRLRRWGGIRAEVLHPPAPPRAYRCDDYGDYLFVVSRLTPLKRIDLIIDALARPAAAGVRCVIAGEGESEPELASRIAAHGLGARVQLVGRLDEAALVAHLARCRAVCFAPLREDYGFVTAEAFASRKPVITCHDSGGPVELVTSEQTGLVAEPSADALASAIERLMRDRDLAERLGEAGYRRALPMTWRGVVGRLVVV